MQHKNSSTRFCLFIRGMPAINPNTSYPGTEADCTKTPHLQHILEHFQTAEVYYNFLLIIVKIFFF